MARGPSFSRIITTMAREAAKAQRRAEAERRRQERETIRATREAARYAAAAARSARVQHVERRLGDVDERNVQLHDRMNELADILAATLRVDDTIDFACLQVSESYDKPFDPRPGTPQSKEPMTVEEFADRWADPHWLFRYLPGARARHKRAKQEALNRHTQLLASYKAQCEKRQAEIATLREAYDREQAEFVATARAKNAEIDKLQESYVKGEPESVVAYNCMVLERSAYPDGFPQEFRVAYVPESRQLVIEYELPRSTVIPSVAEYRYIKTRDEIEEKPRRPSEIKEAYQDVVAAVALRTIHEVCEADQGKHLGVVVFNGFIDTTDPATGRDIRPCLISVRVRCETFLNIDLARIDKKVCLRNLGAQVSPRASEAQPIKPIIEFDMVDKRFVEESDVLTDLESRPNLMDLDPFEFENLVANLFQQMGLETRLTRSSRDGGVDAVAFDPRPVLGGKVVIQAKRYRNTVGVAAVRDLYGTMMNEGANKGILVATSGYGPDAFEFAKDKPIELVDGSALLYLLQQVGVNARIIFPDDTA